MSWVLHIVINSLLLIVVAGYFESFHIDGIGTAIIASLVLTILNIFIKPILVIFTLPITFLTFGLFLFVINAITLMLTSKIIGRAFEIDGFGMAILASILISLLHVLIQRFILDRFKRKRA